MIAAVSLLHEPKRKRPWVVRWYGSPDPETGKQKRYGRLFHHIRDAKAFLIEKQHQADEGAPRDTPVNVTLGRLLAEFEQARLASLSYASRIGYGNTTTQLLQFFGRTRKIRDVQRRHAEAFLASRKRFDGRPGELSSWSKARHLIHCRAIFGAAVEWGYIDRNPFSGSRAGGNSVLRINPKARSWHHLTPDEFQRLLPIVSSVRQRAAYWLMYGCGLRPGEAYNMTAGNIDLQHRRVQL